MSEACEPGREPVSQTEETVTRDGKTRRIVKVRVCKRDIEARAMSAEAEARRADAYALQADAAALSNLREARANLAGEKGLSEKTRAEILADIDRSIAGIQAQRAKRK